MCGFAGLVQLDGSACSPEALRRMSDVIVHRGPDDAGTYVEGPVGLTFRRLAIIDLSACGHQPMQYGDGRYTIVFNGEIYNYLELRAELEAKGHRFRSQSDTEVLLASYAQWGAECLPRLNGMWAFLIHDRQRGVVFGSRDRFGMKPLYRARAGARMLFASEIKSLRASGLVATEPNLDLVGELLETGRMENVLPHGATFFRGVEEVPAASGFELTLGGALREWTFWSPGMHDGARPVAPDEMYAALEASIDRHLRADVRVGVSLSGGLDSTVVACLLARQQVSSEAIRAFTYLTPEFDERPYIDDVVAQTGAVLDARDTGAEDVFANMPRVLWHNDEPVHSPNAAIGLDIYGRAVGADVKVMMAGQGADELLGGYSSGFALVWASLIRRGRVGEARGHIARFIAVHGGDAQVLFRDAARRAVAGVVNGVPGVGALLARRRRSRAERAASFSAVERSSGGAARSLVAPAARTLAEELDAEVTRTPLPLYLRVEDRVSMAQSVESRLPFLDAEVAALAARLPDTARLDGPWNKAIVREATRGLLPESVRTRPTKFGFPVPLATWIRTSLREEFRDVIEGDAVRRRGVYNVPLVRETLRRHLAGEVDAASALFNVVQLEYWFEHVVAADYEAAPQFSPSAAASRALARGVSSPDSSYAAGSPSR